MGVGGWAGWLVDRKQQVESSQALVCKSMQVSILNCSNMQELDFRTLDRPSNLLLGPALSFLDGTAQIYQSSSIK